MMMAVYYFFVNRGVITAMEAKVTDHVWDIGDIVSLLD